MLTRSFLASALLLFAPMLGFSNDAFESMLEEFRVANKEAAADVERLTPLANEGDPAAMLELARSYWALVPMATGDLNQSLKETAWDWYERTAAQERSPEIAEEAMDEVVENYWYLEQIERLRPWAEKGHVEAQYFLADRLSRSEETMTEAVLWHRKAGLAGHVKSISWLAQQYENGWQIEADLPESLEWWKRGDQAGDLEMTYQLARRYHNGYGSRWPEFEKNMPEANQLYLKAGNGGHTGAQEYLAKFFIYVKNGGHADVVTGWLIEKDEGAGYFYRGQMYEKGVGREKDLKKAREHYLKAQDKEYFDAEYAVGRVEAAMAEE